MRIFCDTSLLVAACLARHPHHARALPVLEAVAAGRDEGWISTHSLAELYSALTTVPLDPPVFPSEAEQMMERNIAAHFHKKQPTVAMYMEAVRLCARQSGRGGLVYDALLLECARSVEPDRIYTFNTSHFVRLAPDLAERICAP